MNNKTITKLIAKSDAKRHEAPTKIDDLMGQIKQLQAKLDKHRWIPVSEGLPKHNYSIELLDLGNHIFDGSYDFNSKSPAWYSYVMGGGEIRITSQITHWREKVLPDKEKD